LNAQNFPRPPFKEQAQIDEAHEVMLTDDALRHYGDRTHDAAISCLRGMIKAPKGRVFVDADFSSIENRVSAWIAGQTNVLEQFANGLDEYKAFAVRMYQLDSIEQVTSSQRQVAKSAVLGCMFGQGAKGLVDYAKSMGVTINPDDSKGIVDQYRSTYRKVRDAWYACDKAAKQAIENPGTVVPFIHVAFSYRKDRLWVKLPSGRLIAWFRPRIVDKMMPWGEPGRGITYTGLSRFTHKWTSGQDLIGSSIFQSIVQATARDFLAESALRLKHDIVMLTHDEIMLEVDIEDAGQAEADMKVVMTTPPKWAQGFPVAIETWVGNRFRK
jgi:DNA polymerase